jgi:hypothetical protein
MSTETQPWSSHRDVICSTFSALINNLVPQCFPSKGKMEPIIANVLKFHLRLLQHLNHQRWCLKTFVFSIKLFRQFVTCWHSNITFTIFLIKVSVKGLKLKFCNCHSGYQFWRTYESQRFDWSISTFESYGWKRTIVLRSSSFSIPHSDTWSASKYCCTNFRKYR